VAFGFAAAAWRAPADTAEYVAATPVQSTTAEAWARSGFQLLPARRREMVGEQKEPFTIQIACPQPQLERILSAAGWSAAPPISMRTILLALTPQPELQEMPVVPKFDGGRASELNLANAQAAASPSRNVLRLWRSEWEVTGTPGEAPVWYGAFYRQTQVRRDIGLWRETTQVPQPFEAGLAASGAQRLPGSGAIGPQLWRCTGM